MQSRPRSPLKQHGSSHYTSPLPVALCSQRLAWVLNEITGGGFEKETFNSLPTDTEAVRRHGFKTKEEETERNSVLSARAFIIGCDTYEGGSWNYPITASDNVPGSSSFNSYICRVVVQHNYYTANSNRSLKAVVVWGGVSSV